MLFGLMPHKSFKHQLSATLRKTLYGFLMNIAAIISSFIKDCIRIYTNVR